MLMMIPTLPSIGNDSIKSVSLVFKESLCKWKGYCRKSGIYSRRTFNGVFCRSSKVSSDHIFNNWKIMHTNQNNIATIKKKTDSM